MSHPIRSQRSQNDRTLELWSRHGTWFWQLSSASGGRGVVGAAPSADQAARDVCATLEEIESGGGLIETMPAFLESVLTWSGALERFQHTASQPR